MNQDIKKIIKRDPEKIVEKIPMHESKFPVPVPMPLYGDENYNIRSVPISAFPMSNDEEISISIEEINRRITLMQEKYVKNPSEKTQGNIKRHIAYREDLMTKLKGKKLFVHESILPNSTYTSDFSHHNAIFIINGKEVSHCFAIKEHLCCNRHVWIDENGRSGSYFGEKIETISYKTHQNTIYDVDVIEFSKNSYIIGDLYVSSIKAAGLPSIKNFSSPQITKNAHLYDCMHKVQSSGVIYGKFESKDPAHKDFYLYDCSSFSGACGSLVVQQEGVVGFHTGTVDNHNLFQEIVVDVIDLPFRTLGQPSVARNPSEIKSLNIVRKTTKSPTPECGSQSHSVKWGSISTLTSLKHN